MNIRLVLIFIVSIMICIVVYKKYIQKQDFIFSESEGEYDYDYSDGMNYSRQMEASILKNISNMEQNNMGFVNSTINNLNSRFK